MSLSLLTKTFIFLFFIYCFTLQAQTSDTLENKTKQTKTHLNVEFSGILPIAVGENFAADGMDFNYGLSFSFKGYFNEKIDFEDDATTMIISVATSYRITNQLKVFIKPEYRIDFMRIDTAPIRQDFFDEAHFLNILFGIRFGY
jgi:hypothetical protein